MKNSSELIILFIFIASALMLFFFVYIDIGDTKENINLKSLINRKKQFN